MELLYSILKRGINLRASDIHLVPEQHPIYRVNRKLCFDQAKERLDEKIQNEILQFFYSNVPFLKHNFEEKKQVDFPFTYEGHRFRINVSLTKGVPLFSIRIILNQEIPIVEYGLEDVVKKMHKIKSGLILVTGKVNSGKSTTMNAFLQEINKNYNRKIITLEDPIEYEHVSDKSVVIQKEIGEHMDVKNYYDGLINLFREDPDISVIGEIRDRKTMEVAIDLAESGGLVIATLHTRSCGETVERILNMYDAIEQPIVKNSLSSVIKMIVSQKLVVGTKDELVMVPEIMVLNNILAAIIRQDKFNIGDLEDTIHTQTENGSFSFENSFAKLYLQGKIDMPTIVEAMEPSRVKIIKSIIIKNGGLIDNDMLS